MLVMRKLRGFAVLPADGSSNLLPSILGNVDMIALFFPFRAFTHEKTLYFPCFDAIMYIQCGVYSEGANNGPEFRRE